MKFYEFNDFEYYALIGAETKEEAIKFYIENVADICEEDGEPLELTKDKAIQEVITCLKGEVEAVEIKKEIEKNINLKETFLALIDSSLL